MIRETPQGKIEIFPWHTGNAEAKGLAASGIVLSKPDFAQLLQEMEEWFYGNGHDEEVF